MRVRRTENVLLIVLWYVAHQQLASSKCPVFTALVIPVWARMQLAGVEWFEILNYPGPLEKCVVRKYHPFNETMDWIEKESPVGQDIWKKRYDFILENGQEFLKKDRSFFQQVLDSDLATWVLLHICSEGDKKSKFALTLREPLSVIPADIESQVSRTLRLAGIKQDIKWTRSPCMLNRTITAIFPQPAATLYPPPDAVMPYDPTDAAWLPLETEKPLDAGTPQETGEPQETDIPEQTEINITYAPETIMPPEPSMAPDINVAVEASKAQDTEMSQEVSLSPETETAKELILDPITTPSWIPYYNDEESW